ncbi:PQQ-binding-like beta-propeller repeat protein [Akkermansiaceae bacterium]|nr:PQQ-binding-like beta-propeller repeat protein [Akkermansiaceae bacterium]MDB4537852.1 PQQ-binding-like beta-propeller repeat protein [Akkermansiaceae bacterium]
MKIAQIYFAALILGAGLAPANDWPEFRGPGGQGIGGKTVKKWTEEEIAWKIPVAVKGWSSPVVSEGKIVLTGALKKGDKTHLMVIALDLKTGKELWQSSLFTPDEKELLARHHKNGLASATPVIRDGVIYAHFGHMGTAAVQLENGKAIWKELISYDPVHGGGSSPILVNDLMVFSADGNSDPALIALNTKTGKLAWKTARTATVKRTFSFATPSLVKDAGRDLIISPASGMVGAYDPKDGREVWKVSNKEGWSLVSKPVVMDGMVYTSTGFARASLLAIKLDGAKGDVTESHQAWTASKGIPNTPSFIANEGVLYVLDDTGSLTCFDAKTGESKWREKLPGNFSSSPMFSDGSLYCLTEDGVVYVVEVSPKGGKITFQTDFEEPLFASPVVVDGALFLRSKDHLFKISGKLN